MQKTKLAILSTLAVIVTGCTTQVPYDPQVYGMPQSQFARLTPQQQQQAARFHTGLVQADTMTGTQVAKQSSDNVTQVVVTTHGSGTTKKTTTKVVAPSRGNPDLSSTNNPDLVGAVTQQQTPVVVNTQ